MPENENEVNIRELRRQAEEGQAARDENLILRRQMAFRDAGYDPKNSLVAFAMKNYDGEANAEAVTQFLTDMGIQPQSATPPPAETPPPPTPDPKFNADLADKRQALSADGTPNVPGERVRTDPYDAIFARREQAVRQGEDMDAVRAQCVEAIMGAAALGDERVIVQRKRTGMENVRL